MADQQAVRYCGFCHQTPAGNIPPQLAPPCLTDVLNYIDDQLTVKVSYGWGYA